MDGTNRGEAERWLYTANKLLSARDLHGARSFAIRARESDPRFEATELLLAVIDTLLAGEARIKEHLDYYAVLQIIRYTQNIEYIADQYRRLAILLDPNRNPFAYAAHAFSLVHDAWSIFSNPHKKALYDEQLHFLTQPPPPQQQPIQPPPQQQQQFFQPPSPPQPQPQPIQSPYPQVQVNHNHSHSQQQRKNPRSSNEARVVHEEQNNGPSYDNADEHTGPRPRPAVDRPGGTDGGSFWTACPYCFGMFEYPKVYEDCTLRCQNCRRGFHAVVVRAPPELTEDEGGKDGGSFCSFGYFPLGFTGNFKDISGSSSEWNPISPLFPCPSNSKKDARKGPVSYYDHDTCAAFAELSDETEDDTDDDDWRNGNGTSGKKMGKRRRRRRRTFGGGAGDERRPIDRPRRVVQNGNAGNDNGGGSDNVVDGEAVDAVSAPRMLSNVEASKRAVLSGVRRRGAGNLGKLDLNVEFSNEVEEAVAAAGMKEGNVNGTGNAEDNIEGIGFFEGLDEFLNSLPILNVVADDKVKCH
ncbi:hypothetical protein P8452_11416 [Trifolium repens]|nr:hypothetical protein P8452_11416 [Trifolium repens]